MMLSQTLDTPRPGLKNSIQLVLSGNFRVRPWGAVAAVMVATLMTSYYTRIFALALADLRGVWGLSYDQGAELNTVATALQLLSAPAIPLISAIIGARRVLLYCALSFALVTFITPFVTGIQGLFIVHGMTAVLLGCFIPATLAVVFKNLPPRFWLLALSFYTLRLTFATYSGVSLTGLYIEKLGWQWVYWQQTLLALVVAVLVTCSLPTEKINKALWKNADKGSVALFCISLTMIFAGLDEGNRLDWFESGEITALIGGGICMLAACIIWQFFSPNPSVHPRVLRRNVSVAMGTGAFFGFLSMAGALVIPNFLGTVGHLKAEQSGNVMWLTIFLQIFFVPLSIWLIRRIDVRLIAGAGVLFMMAGCWMGTFITHEWRSADFIPVLIAFAAGNAFVFQSVMVIAVANVRMPDVLAVLAYAQIPRVVGPTLASSMVTTLITNLEKMHSALLVPYIEPSRQSVWAHDPTLSSLSSLVQREAYVLAYRDVYEICFLLGLGALFVLFLARPAPANALTPSGYKS